MKILKVAAISVGVLVGLVLLTYGTLVAINWNDRAPTATTKEFSRFLAEIAPVADRDNAYVFMLGFSGGPDVDPAELGLERQRWLIDAFANAEFDPGDDPQSAYDDSHKTRSEAVDALANTCRQSGADCLMTIAADKTAAVQWLADESWFLERYRQLIAYPDFRAAVPFELLAPSPDFSIIFDGQRLLFIAAYLEAKDGNVDHVLSQFDQDFTFWRRVLRQSDTLIMKMIATAGIKNHFKWGNHVLRALPQSGSRNAIPDTWFEAINDEERSMKRCLIGEWRFSANVPESVHPDSQNPRIADYYSGPTWLEKIGWYIFQPLWQPQDLRNGHAAMLATVIDLFDTSYDGIPEALAKAASASSIEEERRFTAYNPIGNLAYMGGHKLFADYAVRVTYLEGIRRAAVVTSQLRAQGLAGASLHEALNSAEMKNPYTGEPFTWHSESNAVVFRGLQANNRGEHRFAY